MERRNRRMDGDGWMSGGVDSHRHALCAHIPVRVSCLIYLRV